MEAKSEEINDRGVVPAPAIEAAALGVEAIVQIVQLPIPNQPPVVNPAYYQKSHQPLGPTGSPFWI